MRNLITRLSVVVAAGILLGACPSVAGSFHVALTGNDTTGTGSAASPFRSIQRALTAAAAAADGNDEINVASGPYSTPGIDLGIVVNASANIEGLLIRGGFDAGFVTRTPQSSIYIPQTVGSTNGYDVDVRESGVTIDGFFFVFDGTFGPGGTRRSGGLRPGPDFTLNNCRIEVGSSSTVNAFDAFGIDALVLPPGIGQLTLTNVNIHCSAEFRSTGIRLHSGLSATSIQMSRVFIDGATLMRGISGGTATTSGITLSELIISGAFADGIALNGVSGPLNINGSQFRDNGGDGIELIDVEAVSFNSVVSTGNSRGLIIQGASNFVDVTGTFSRNEDVGMQLQDVLGNASMLLTVADNNNADNDSIGDGLVVSDGSDSDSVSVSGTLEVRSGSFSRTAEPGSHQLRGAVIQNAGGLISLVAASPSLRMRVTGNESHGLFIGDSASVLLREGNYSNNGGAGITLSNLSGFATLQFLNVNSNAGHGIVATDTTSALIGTLPLGVVGSVISSNGGDGVRVNSGTVGILGNLISSNGGMGIEVLPPLVNPNDPRDLDAGANDLQNFPVLTGAASGGSSTFVTGSLNSVPSLNGFPSRNYRIDLFSNDSCDSTGHGEGQFYLHSMYVTTDAQGDAPFEVVIAGAVPTGKFLTATAMDSQLNSSEFSLCKVVTAAPAIGTVDPDRGSIRGGTVVTLTGSNFQPGATVSFGGIPATAVSVDSPTTITATTPAHARGIVDVIVRNPDSGSVTLPVGYRFGLFDPNGDGSLTILDVFYLIGHLFAGGPPSPGGARASDANGDSNVNAADVVYLLNFLFAGGPEPE